MYQGKSLRVVALEDGFYELCFDREGDAINKLDARTVRELREAVTAVAGVAGLRGLLFTSAKDVFIVGADITEFGATFKKPNDELAAWNLESKRSLDAIEALNAPSVVAINGFALGGGLEMALAADYRVMSTAAQVGLPEVKLGLFPGLGGTARLARVAGQAVAIDWIAGGAPSKAPAALQAGVVDAVAEPDALRATALGVLKEAAEGRREWRGLRTRRAGTPEAAPADLFAQAKARVARTAPKHQPAALAAVELLERCATLTLAQAQVEEAHAFAAITKTQAAGSLVQIFLSEQAVKKRSRQRTRQALPVRQAAVLGAGIMGGGIAYTSALRGTPVRMKDIRQEALDLGINEARKLLGKQTKSGRLSEDKAAAVLASIVPQLDNTGFDGVDVVVEAVVENLRIKHSVLTELESAIRRDAVIASNTSSLRIDDLAAPLERPENFVGMHFFNPVPAMPLVEVIRGSRSSEAAVATVVAYALAMGKTPIVVKDGPGFLVNRIITPYMLAFCQLIADGADFVAVDQAMEAFGWPMGPAYLNDVVGMDTGLHVAEQIRNGFAERMALRSGDPLALMVQNGRLGQKNGIGFYRYDTDPAGKPRKQVADDSHALLSSLQTRGRRSFTDAEIAERMMLPLILESARCLEEGVVESPAELDMALLLGLGFPQYLGGPLQYADWLGLPHVVERAQQYASLGPQYAVPEGLVRMAAAGERYYAD